MSDVQDFLKGFPPEAEIFDIASFRLQVLKGPHSWATAHVGEIAENWKREVAANPALFDGQMVLQQQLTFADGHIEGEARMASYSAFLHWRGLGRPPGAHHLFAMPLIMSSDGAVVAIRMGSKTANPGRIYCAAGSMDGDDVVDGLCDLDFSMARELYEETSLRLEEAEAAPGYRGLVMDNTVAVYRLFHYKEDAETLAQRIRRHVAAEPDPEIDGPVIIRDAAPHHDYAYFMLPILKTIFEKEPR